MDEPVVIIAFGITGDLMRLKILPALFGLYSKGQLPEKVRIVGVSRRAWRESELRAYIQEMVPKADATFLSCFYMLQGDVDESVLYEALGALFLEWEADWQTTFDCIFYLSVAPTLYEAAFSNLALFSLGFSRLAGNGEGNRYTRICIEKPFGNNGASAAALDLLLKKTFTEEDTYRVDHYLAKPFAEEILHAPLPNPVREVSIRLWETVGVEKRGAFYDATGALRDVGQNHLLQLVALLALDKTKNTREPLPEKRAEIMERLTAPSQKALVRSVRAQYEGYAALEGVAPGSQTETYFKIEATLHSPQWEGVPIVLESGKRLPEVRKEVVITFTNGEQLLFKDTQGKTPEYERLLFACMKGEKSLFVSGREIKAEWAFIDPIIAAWRAGAVPLVSYAPGTVPREEK